MPTCENLKNMRLILCAKIPVKKIIYPFAEEHGTGSEVASALNWGEEI